MEVVALLLYVGAVWVIGAIGLFTWNIGNHSQDHADRLALMPLEDNWTDPLRVRTNTDVDSGKNTSP